MARPLRLEYPGALYHITSRGNERKKIFLDDEERKLFQQLLTTVVEKHQWVCHAYCLMDNHYHLLVEVKQPDVSEGMGWLNGVYTQKINRRRKRVGHLFQGRFKSVLVQKESHLLEVARYIVLNPVRARIVKSPSDWEWSSFRATAGACKPPKCLATDWILVQFAKTRAIARRRYAEFVMEGIDSKSIWNGLRAKSVLGKKEFLDEISGLMGEDGELPVIPKYQKHISRPSLEELAGTDDLGESEGRVKFIRSAVDGHGYSQSEVARFLGINQSTVSRIVGGGNA